MRSTFRTACSRCLLSAVLIAFGALVASSATAFSVFTDRTAWEAAVAGSMIVDDPFDNNIVGALQITFDSGVVSTTTAAGFFPDDNGVDSGRWENANDGDAIGASMSTTWDFPMAIIGFGADWEATADIGPLTVTGDFDGTGLMTVNFGTELGGDGTGFLGIVGLDSFDQVTFESASNFLEIYTADNLSFAKAGTPIPEPSAVLCFAVGFGVLGAAQRRRRI